LFVTALRQLCPQALALRIGGSDIGLRLSASLFNVAPHWRSGREEAADGTD
jgi:hypothetical protein